MSGKSKHRKRKGGGGGRAVSGPNAPAVLDELAEAAQAVADADPAAAGPRWGAVHRLLLRTEADPGEVGGMVARRDVDDLLRLVARLRSGKAKASAAEDDRAAAPAPGGGGQFSPEELRHALLAFKKRLKLTRLDEESKLGANPLTGGRTSEIRGIMPPRDFPDSVWEALVAEGRLKRMGKGFYELP